MWNLGDTIQSTSVADLWLTQNSFHYIYIGWFQNHTQALTPEPWNSLSQFSPRFPKDLDALEDMILFFLKWPPSLLCFLYFHMPITGKIWFILESVTSFPDCIPRMGQGYHNSTFPTASLSCLTTDAQFSRGSWRLSISGSTRVSLLKDGYHSSLSCQCFWGSAVS